MAFDFYGYTFTDPVDSEAQLFAQQGIYTIWSRSGSGEWKLLDIGESSDVRARISRHDRADQWRRAATYGATIMAAVMYTPGWSEALRCETEAALRAVAKPPCGDR